MHSAETEPSVWAYSLCVMKDTELEKLIWSYSRRSRVSGRIPCIRSAKARAACRPAQGEGRNRKVPLDRGCLRERAKQQGARLRLRQGLRLSKGDASGVWRRRVGHTCASGQGVQVVVRVIVWPGRGRPVALHLREQLPTDKTRQREDTTSREVSRCGSPRSVAHLREQLPTDKTRQTDIDSRRRIT